MNLHIKLPTLRPIRLQPQPITEDDDLAKAIANDTQSHDDAWELTEFGDGEALERFWDEAANERSAK